MKVFTFPFDSDEHIIKTISNWDCLKKFGYSYLMSKKHSYPNNIVVSSFIFENFSTNRQIEFAISRGVSSIFIINTDGSKSKYINGSFSVERWLIYNKKNILEQYSDLKFFEVCKNSQKEGIEPLFNFLEPLFRGPLKPVLIGERWDNIPRDVLFGNYD